jgi:hypothetical protein
VHDHFLELGGHSLAAIRMVARMKEALHLPVTCVFERPRVTGLAELVEETILELIEE